MNSRQRREFRRFIHKKLYEFVYERNYKGCKEFDLYPSKAKMYIDYPSKENDDIVYVTIPSFHLINSKAKAVGLKGDFTFKVSKNSRLLSLKNVSVLKEITPFEEEYPETLHHGRYPQFMLPIQEGEAYIIKESYYNGDISIIIFNNNIQEETRRIVSFEDLLNDVRLSKRIRTELAFNIDLFEKINDED